MQNNRQTFIFSLEQILLLVCNLVFIWNVPRAMIGRFAEWRGKSSARVLQCCNLKSETEVIDNILGNSIIKWGQLQI